MVLSWTVLVSAMTCVLTIATVEGIILSRNIALGSFVVLLIAMNIDLNRG